MITDQEILDARKRIAELFDRQCRHGKQATTLPDGIIACGQFLEAPEMEQRGLHGTASALRVLGGQKDQELTEGLVSYLLNRESYEEAPKGPEKLAADSNNVVKQSEILNALFYSPSSDNVNKLKQALIKRLRDGMIRDQGWPYFLDEPDGPQPLPTLLAMGALLAHRQPVGGAVNFLLGYLKRKHTRQADVFVQTAILFGLTFLPDSDEGPDEKRLRTELDRLWRSLEPLLEQDLESNLEYTRRENEYLYVRVPWQLYLIASAARLRPFRRFASASATRRLSVITKSIQAEEGFSYPHSTDRLSSRTYGTIYDVLSKIQSLHRRAFRSQTALAFDKLRRFLGSKWVTLVLGLAAIGFFAASYLSWRADPKSELADFFPGFVMTGIAFAVAGIRKRP